MNPGTRLGSFEIVEQIGTGGMGEVYRARDLRLGPHRRQTARGDRPGRARARNKP